MRKTVSSRIIFCATILALSLAAPRFDVIAAPGVIRVPTDFTKIQEAINAANSGDTILVDSGTYPGNIVVNKTLSIIGENRESTIIDGLGNAPAVNVTGSNVVFEGFTVRNGAYGLYLHYSSGSTIANNAIIESTGDSGLLLDHSTNSVIANNTVANNQEVGIYLYYSSGNTISHNNSTNNLVGLWLLYSNGNSVLSNNASGNSYGLWLEFSGSNTLRDNKIANNIYNFGVHSATLTNFIQDIDSSNKVNEKPIYYLVNQQSQQIPSDAGYVAAVNSTNITIRDLHLANNREGVVLAYTNNSSVEGNIVSNSSEAAIHLHKSNGNTITNNSIGTARDGVLLDSSSSNVATNNTITECSEYGIWLVSSNGNTISINNITDNWVGSMLTSSGGNIIQGNDLARNDYGIWLISSSNNNIRHNNFNNTNQVRSRSGSVNLWDNGYSSGGNYWSNYAGVDLYWGSYQNKTGSDGIGDTPFVIDSNNQDKYPLMSPYEYWSNPIIGDINKDTMVNAIDLSQLAGAYGSTPEKPNWHPNSDLNSDNLVNAQDLFSVGKNYGKTNQ